MTDPTSHSELPDSEDSPALRIALLELLASNVRDYKRQQWSTAYYGLLVHGAIVGYFSLRSDGPTIGQQAGYKEMESQPRKTRHHSFILIRFTRIVR